MVTLEENWHISGDSDIAIITFVCLVTEAQWQCMASGPLNQALSCLRITGSAKTVRVAENPLFRVP